MTHPLFLTSPELAGTSHGFFTRKGGVSRGIYDSLNVGLGSDDTRADVLKNRERVRQALSAAHLVTPYQSHSTVTAFIDAPQTSPIQADALVTRTVGIAIGVLTADCAPILLADLDNGVIGAAHSGWRGAFDGVLQSVVTTMCDHGAQRATLKAVIGPCISQVAYEVGPEFVARFEASFGDDMDLFVPALDPEHAHHKMFDLAAFITRQLTRLDVQTSRTPSLPHCTYTQVSDFFSYRRTTHKAEPDYGRQISAICL